MARRAYHHGNLRNALLETALSLFAQRGSFDFTLRELARAAGVTHNAPYRHFDGKAALLSALRAQGFAELDEVCRAALARAADEPRARIRALGEGYVRFALERPQMFRLVLHNPLEPGEDELGEAADAGRAAPTGGSFLLLRKTIAEAQMSGHVRDDLRASELALAAWSLVHGLASLAVSGRLALNEQDLKRHVRSFDRIFFEGVNAGRAPVRRRPRSSARARRTVTKSP